MCPAHMAMWTIRHLHVTAASQVQRLIDPIDSVVDPRPILTSSPDTLLWDRVVFEQRTHFWLSTMPLTMKIVDTAISAFFARFETERER